MKFRIIEDINILVFKIFNDKEIIILKFLVYVIIVMYI